MTWYTDFRQTWIAEMLHVYGFIGRAQICRKFGVSVPQASADLQAFQKANPDAMTYDLSRKRYVATASPNSASENENG